MSKFFTFKVHLNGDSFHRFSLQSDEAGTSISAFRNTVSSIVFPHQESPPTVTISWVDDDGDLCTLGSDRELKEALRLWKTSSTIRLSVTSKHVPPSPASSTTQPPSQSSTRPLSVHDSTTTIAKSVATKEVSARVVKRPEPLKRTLPMSRIPKESALPSSSSSSSSAGGKADETSGRSTNPSSVGRSSSSSSWGDRASKARASSRCLSKPSKVLSPKKDFFEEGKWACTFVRDLSLPNGIIVSPGTHRKVWLLRNKGLKEWNGVKLAYVGGKGAKPIGFGSVDVPVCGTFEEVEVAIDVVVPNEAGRYMGFFKLVRPNGKRFGPRLWVEVVCEAPDAIRSLRVEERARLLVRSILDLGISKDEKLIENLLVLHACDVDKVISDLGAIEAARQTSRGASLNYWITPKALSGSESEEEMTKRHAGHLPRRTAAPEAPAARASLPIPSGSVASGSSGLFETCAPSRETVSAIPRLHEELRSFRGKEFGRTTGGEGAMIPMKPMVSTTTTTSSKASASNPSASFTSTSKASAPNPSTSKASPSTSSADIAPTGKTTPEASPSLAVTFESSSSSTAKTTVSDASSSSIAKPTTSDTSSSSIAKPTTSDPSSHSTTTRRINAVRKVYGVVSKEEKTDKEKMKGDDDDEDRYGRSSSPNSSSWEIIH